jgi:hypothetical protein
MTFPYIHVMYFENLFLKPIPETTPVTSYVTY